MHAGNRCLEVLERTANNHDVHAFSLDHIVLEILETTARGDGHEAGRGELIGNRATVVVGSAQHRCTGGAVVGDGVGQDGNDAKVAGEALLGAAGRKRKSGVDAHAAIAVGKRLEDRGASARCNQRVAAGRLREHADGVTDEGGVLGIHGHGENFGADRRAARGREELRAVAAGLRVAGESVLATQVGGNIDRQRAGVGCVGAERAAGKRHRHDIAVDASGDLRANEMSEARRVVVAPDVVDRIAGVRQQRALAIEILAGQRGVLRGDIAGLAAELHVRSLASSLDLDGGRRSRSEIDDERQRGRPTDLSQHANDLALRHRVKRVQRQSERSNGQTLDGDEILGHGEFNRRILRIDEELEQLGNSVLSGGGKALFAEMLLALRLRKHGDRLRDALGITREIATTRLDTILDASGEIGNSTHGAAAGNGARKALGRIAAVDGLGKISVGDRCAKHRLASGLREISLADQHIVDEILNALGDSRQVLRLRFGRATVLSTYARARSRKQRWCGRENSGGDKHRRERKADAGNERRIQGHRGLQ